uniref:Uncharacterized protein n=1 Tax=Timema tahoe TaxID=61484 RepID=A0A7R9NU76_9NEOP|nr:unnamed protein product [Timema tahoe]
MSDAVDTSDVVDKAMLQKAKADHRAEKKAQKKARVQQAKSKQQGESSAAIISNKQVGDSQNKTDLDKDVENKKKESKSTTKEVGGEEKVKKENKPSTVREGKFVENVKKDGKTEPAKEVQAKKEVKRPIKTQAKKDPKAAGETNKVVHPVKKEVKIVEDVKHKNVIAKKASAHRKMKLFTHLHRKKATITVNSQDLHPAVVNLGSQYMDRVIVGSNARCLAFLHAMKQVIKDYNTPPQKKFSHGLEDTLHLSMEFLHQCRPVSVSMNNALRHLKWQLMQLTDEKSDAEAKGRLNQAIETYILEQIEMAQQAICNTMQKKIVDKDVVIVYGCSSSIQRTLKEASERGIKFRVVVMDDWAWREGKELLRRLVKLGLKCSYAIISAASLVMGEATKVLLGAHALLANGSVMARAGTSQIALLANAYNVPVLVCCETHKCCERALTDSFGLNELIEDPTSVGAIRLAYDVTPPDFISAVITEVAVVPCTMALLLMLNSLVQGRVEYLTVLPQANESYAWILHSIKENGSVAATAEIGVGIEGVASWCSSSENEIRCRWDSAEVRLLRQNEECMHVEWLSTNTSGNLQQFEDCFDLGEDHWFGGPEIKQQYWPFEKYSFTEAPYVTRQVENQGLADPYWVNSKGFYIFVDDGVPLFVDQNNHRDGSLCLIAKNIDPYPPSNPNLTLSYTMCTLGNARTAHEHAIGNYIGKPSGVPDERMFRHPIWSTWAKYKKDIDEDVVRELGDQIISNGFNNSQLEIDEMWEECFGSLVFNKTKFPDIRNLTDGLKEKGFRVTLWTPPFINLDCEPYHNEALEKGYFVKNTQGDTETTWWEGQGGIVDFTNPDAVDWWLGRVRANQELSGVDSLKFDAGETSFMPQLPVLNASLDLNPSIFTTKYVETVSQFGRQIEVRSARRTNRLPIFLRMLDKDTNWGWDNGLKTLVTTLLVMNMAGYSFVLPDMIGGNGYGDSVPTKELFIRWLEANALMPALQFSFVPWDFDEETVTISRKFTVLHAEYSDVILERAARAVEDGSPLNPPIWWVDPENAVAQTVDDEFLLGEDILVAPVLEEGATSRDIYLPQGLWRDNMHPDRDPIQGRTWLRDYPVALDQLPFFTMIPDTL